MSRDAFPTEEGVESSIQTTIWFGKYRIVECIGIGGFSRVYLAEHLKLKTLRAIKQIPKSDTDMSSFLSEAELLKNLKHPGIPIIFDIEEDENSIFVIEEYIEGESLEAFVLHQSKISERKIVEIGIQLCEILNYLHQLKPYPLLYLDMKPQHVFLSGNQVRLVDFGISSYLDGKRNSYPSYGTEGFAAPEQYQQELPGVQTDIYGAGCILSFLSEQGQEVSSKNLNRIIKRATEKEISSRYTSAAEMKQELLALERRKKPKRKKRTEQHLLKSIAVCTSGKRNGSTHFSIALNSFLNEEGYKSFYQEENTGGALRKIRKTKRGIVEKEGFVYYEYFCGKTYLGGKAKAKEDFDFQVLDYGFEVEDTAEIEKADWIILLLGARDWEKEDALSALERYRYIGNLLIVCNYGDERTAREYARKAGKRVYCFPLDLDPFCVNKEKIRFFQKMLRQEGW